MFWRPGEAVSLLSKWPSQRVVASPVPTNKSVESMLGNSSTLLQIARLYSNRARFVGFLLAGTCNSKQSYIVVLYRSGRLGWIDSVPAPTETARMTLLFAPD